MTVNDASAAAGRQRRTVHFDAVVLQRLLDDCLRLELQRRQRAQPLCLYGQPLPWLTEACRVGGSEALEPRLARHLLAMLKAFADAARPASGLPLDEQGLPRDLPGLLAEGCRLSLAGAEPPRLLRNVRAGSPVDGRLAQAVLCFFRVFLERPQLSLDDVGACASERLQLARSLGPDFRSGQAGLTEAAVASLLAKSHEALAHPWVLGAFEREYRQLQLLRDERGLLRIALQRISRYTPFKLADFERPHRPGLCYEWHEWSRFSEPQLTLRRLDAKGRPQQQWLLPVAKRLDERLDLIVVEPIPAAIPADALRLLEALGSAPPGRTPPCQFEWQERMLINAADRDLIVSYSPIVSLQLRCDPAAQAEFSFGVGDSPGLVQRDGAWHLERALLPREVLAVRMRWKGLSAQQALQASATGEIAARLD